MKITRFKFYGKWRWRTPGPSGKGWRGLTAEERKEAFGRKWMYRQTICLRIAVKKKYHSIRFSEYRLKEEDLSSKEDFEKKAWQYFGEKIGKYSHPKVEQPPTYSQEDIQSHWAKLELSTKSEEGIESPTKIPYVKKAIDLVFEEA